MATVTIEVVKEVTMSYNLEIDESKYDNLEEIVNEIKDQESRWKLQEYEDNGVLTFNGEYDDQTVTLKRVVLAEEVEDVCPICEDDTLSCYCGSDGFEVEDRYDIIISC